MEMGNNEYVKVELDNNIFVYIESTLLGKEQNVSFKSLKIEEITTIMKLLCEKLIAPIKAITPNKASIEFGIEFGMEAGNMIALLAKGSVKSNLKVIVEWNDK